MNLDVVDDDLPHRNRDALAGDAPNSNIPQSFDIQDSNEQADCPFALNIDPVTTTNLQFTIKAIIGWEEGV